MRAEQNVNNCLFVLFVSRSFYHALCF